MPARVASVLRRRAQRGAPTILDQLEACALGCRHDQASGQKTTEGRREATDVETEWRACDGGGVEALGVPLAPGLLALVPAQAP